MNELYDPFEPIDPFEAFKRGKREAFRHFFRQHNYRIYIYLLRQTRDRRQARELTKYCFLVLFRNYTIVKDEAYMLRMLYVLSRLSLLLQLSEADAIPLLESSWMNGDQEDGEIMDDPTVAGNETLHTIQQALQNLSRGKRELAERYFFQGMSIKEIAQFLDVEEAVVRENITELLQRLGDNSTGGGKMDEGIKA